MALSERTEVERILTLIQNLSARVAKIEERDVGVPIFASTALGAFAYRPSAQTLAVSGTWYPISFTTELHDTDGCFAATDTKIYARTAGYYTVGGGAILNAGFGLTINISKNGTVVVAQSDGGINDAAFGRMTICIPMLYLAVNDYIEVYVKQHSGSSQSLHTGSSGNYMNWGAISRTA